MRAIGVPQFGAYLAGAVKLEEAMTLAVHATRQYAKRQSTWFRNQFLGAKAADRAKRSARRGILSSTKEAIELVRHQSELD